VSGPALPLTVSAAAGQDLLGGGDAAMAIGPRSVMRVLVNGEPVAPPAGRSDDFKWPRRAIAPFGTDPLVATTKDPLPVMQPAPVAAAPATDAKTADAKLAKKTGGKRQTRHNSGSGSFNPFR
jgi:hypothetical protein